jgi:hypothetical protein
MWDGWQVDDVAVGFEHSELVYEVQCLVLHAPHIQYTDVAYPVLLHHRNYRSSHPVHNPSKSDSETKVCVRIITMLLV